MNDLPVSLYLGSDVKKLDKLALEHLKISGYQLMCRAGQAAFNVLQEQWPHAKTITVCCGPGNNGGDGFVLARLAKAQGMQVTVYAIGEIAENKTSQEAKQAKEEWLATGAEIIRFQGQTLNADVIVDALLGIGAYLPMAPEFQNAILAINKSQCPVLAIDLPSGLHADLGSFEHVVKASVTLTVVALKIGLVSGNAIDVVGTLVFDSLGVSPGLFSQVKPCAWRIVYEDIIQALPTRRLSSNKGDNGHVCVIGGGQIGYSGAVCLAGESALRAGAGLVSAIVEPLSLPLMARSPAELMVYGYAKPKEMNDLIERATILLLGPGLSQTKWGESFFHATLKTNKTLLVDADGLNWLARFPQKRSNWILTPHPGEAARLLGTTTQKVQQDRLNAAIALKEKYDGVIVLKGAGTIVVAENGEIAVNIGGNPALSTGGTGDVLGGLIASLVAQRLSLSQAACLGVSVHFCAATIEKSLGARGMLASDLFLHIRSLINPEGK